MKGLRYDLKSIDNKVPENLEISIELHNEGSAQIFVALQDN